MNLESTRFIQGKDSGGSVKQTNSLRLKRRKSSEGEAWKWQDFLKLKDIEVSMEGITFFAASASSGTSKPLGMSRDEDRFDVARLPVRNQVKESVHQFGNSFFAAVFDGHGGAQASQYVKDNLKVEFYNRYQNSESDSEIPELLKQSFIQVDSNLYQELLVAQENASKKKAKNCTCKFYLENPCRCLNAEREARSGSTGTAIVLQNNILYVANIGDTEACLFSYQDVKAKKKKVCNDVMDETILSSPLFKELQDLQKTKESSRLDVIKTKLLKTFVDIFYEEQTINTIDPHIIELTTIHTPTIENHDDYARIASIAIKRQIEMSFKGKHIEYGDGIKKGTEERFNYVRFPGAHSLNMTRAFGNFGHKVYHSTKAGHTIDILNSPVLPIPDLSYFNLGDCENQCFLVLASDGLWDNLSKVEIYEHVMKYVKKSLLKVWRLVENSTKYQDSTSKVKAEVVLGVLASNCSKSLTKAAVNSKKKFDDVTVVVVLFNSILSVFL